MTQTIGSLMFCRWRMSLTIPNKIISPTEWPKNWLPNSRKWVS